MIDLKPFPAESLYYDCERVGPSVGRYRFFQGVSCFGDGSGLKSFGVHTNVLAGTGCLIRRVAKPFPLHGFRVWSEDERVRAALASCSLSVECRRTSAVVTTHAGAALYAPNSGLFYPMRGGPAEIGEYDEVVVCLEVENDKTMPEGLVRVELVGTPMRARVDGVDVGVGAIERRIAQIDAIARDVGQRVAAVAAESAAVRDLLPYLEKRVVALETAATPKAAKPATEECEFCGGTPAELRRRSSGLEAICTACLRQRVAGATLVRLADQPSTGPAAVARSAADDAYECWECGRGIADANATFCACGARFRGPAARFLPGCVKVPTCPRCGGPGEERARLASGLALIACERCGGASVEKRPGLIARVRAWINGPGAAAVSLALVAVSVSAIYLTRRSPGLMDILEASR